MEEDDMDSLFEGMVLFTPSQLSQQQLHNQNPSPPPPAANLSSSEIHQSHSQPKPKPIDDDQQKQEVVVVVEEEEHHQPPQSEPLDENLFSDLTLVSPSLHNLSLHSDTIPPSPPPPSSSTISRQISRKKKRAAGLRIGYGRDPSLDDQDHLDAPIVPTLHSHSSSPDARLDSQQFPSTSVIPPHQQHHQHHRHEEAQFDHIKTLISDKLNRVRELAASVSAAHKESIRRRRKAAQDLNLASIKHRELELQLEAACENEDFERAERISDGLAAAEKDQQTLLNALRDAEAHCDSIDSKLQDVLESHIAAEEDSASLLEQFSTDAANDADLIFKKAETLSSKEMDEWLLSTEALEVKKIELEIESQLVNEACMTVNNSIEQLVEDERREKEGLCKKGETLTDELQKLLALVKEKEKEIVENDSEIKAVEERIANVVSSFQEMQSSIDKKYDNLQLGLSQLSLQNEDLSTRKREIDEFLGEEEDRGTKIRELARISADEAKAYREVVGLRKGLMLSVLKSREDKVRLAKTEEKLSEDVQMLQQEVSAARASLQDLSSTKSVIQQSITSFKQRIFFIDKRLPELEAEKKVAATARNFKEAARIAAEAKSLSLEKDSIEIDMDKAVLDLQKHEEDIKDTISRLQETEGLILSKEKEVATARFQRLILIASSAMVERSAALELGYLEEANLLLADAEAANSEAEKLKPIYDFKEEEFAGLQKQFISMELVSKLGKKQLAELAASVNYSAGQ